jgi:hypothetical protein
MPNNRLIKHGVSNDKILCHAKIIIVLICAAALNISNRTKALRDL